MKILLIRFSALGDVAMMAPVLRRYALEYPQDELTVLSKPFHAPLFDDIAPNVHFLGRDPKHDYRGIRGLYRLFSELHQMRFDLVLDMHDVLRTKILRKFFRVRGYPVRHIDKHRSLRRKITAPEGKKQLRRLPTSFENYAAVLFGKQFEAQTLSELTREDSKTLSELTREDSKTLSELAGEESKGTPHSLLPGKERIGIAPFAAHKGKIYPVERMERVIELLIERRPESRIILFGGGGKEREQMTAWAGKYYNVVLASEEIRERGLSYDSPLRNELEIMRTLDVMVSMDSGNMHMASLVGTRVVSIWGATHPWAGFLGWGQSEDDCVQRCDLGCRPCSIYGNKPCLRGDMECMSIEPEEIVKRILR